MRILILTHRVPFPQNGGYAIVVCNTIRGLVNQGHEVSLVALNARKNHHEHTDDDNYLLSKINYRAYDIDTNVSVLDVAVNLFSRTSFNIDKYYDAEFEKLLVRELRNKDYDIIQFEGLYVSLYLPAVRKASKAKLIYRSHNIENQVWQRMSEQKNDPFKKSYLKMHAKRIKNYELQQLNSFDGIAVFTNQDRNTLLGYGINIPIEELPVGLNLEHYKPDFTKTEFPSLFFLGSLDWLPNREGIEWFIENFNKDLTDGDLRVKFYVAGNDIPERFDDYDVMGKIFIQGEVDDALEFVNSKSIMIVPLMSGGGMRVKIVEGMAMQKCIISTSLGAEGINYTNHENIIIANNYDEFYEAIKLCISDEDFCKNIGINARKLMEEQHNLEKVTNMLVSFYDTIKL
ncbi:MAG: glycosyltransferase family 4 protein [Mucilaginibacter sp.]|uniref:glycosyltransferase family 4 protein n=1 Tax=Mucilaginibacter sp. L3T2-6 TaxID=3062491 RepID=UPI002674DE68|nr:glycosyltransferase family 4 protein [Mucilaginibacter sp. L3T2-6]MDO3644309.1 glycosyltransferase family 4 protein [Mucilaginibacter sp. L3T2-6]MDV6216760.1 glycosyltransferase family 4 protein [Mucilaginibacter sp. L3T2-6]